MFGHKWFYYLYIFSIISKFLHIANLYEYLPHNSYIPTSVGNVILRLQIEVMAFKLFKVGHPIIAL